MPAKYLILVVGPTAVGKTSFAIALAEHYKTEIISADSRQFYKEMSIGTAVPSKKQLQQVPHHFIQHLSILDPYSVGTFEKEALKRMELLFKKRNEVLMVGGSGLYIEAVVRGLDKFPEISPEVRMKVRSLYQQHGVSALQQQVKERDPEYYRRVDVNNPQRLSRALEVCLEGNMPYSSYLKKSPKSRPFKSITIGLHMERERLYERINKRVDQMIQEGLLEEAEKLFQYRHLNALQTVGYKELFNYMDGQYSLETAIDEIKKNTRRFAKRQLTWFRKQDDILWVDPSCPLSELLVTIEKRK